MAKMLLESPALATNVNLQSEIHRLSQQLRLVHRQVDESLALARRLNGRLVPDALPDFPGVHFAVYPPPADDGYTGFYDVIPLGRQQVALCLGHVLGQGLPACLLSLLVKQLLRDGRAMEVERLLAPGQVLEYLNRELIAQRFDETPLIRMIYGVMDMPGRSLRFARAGHPCPLILRRDGAIETWDLDGTLLGVVEGSYLERTEHLSGGEKLILFSHASDMLVECARLHRQLGITELVQRLGTELKECQPAKEIALWGIQAIDPGEG